MGARLEVVIFDRGKRDEIAYAILIWEGDNMIDAIQLPILMKAIDFLFEEGRKILEERRQRRLAQDGAAHAGREEKAGAENPAETGAEAQIGEEKEKAAGEGVAPGVGEILNENQIREAKKRELLEAKLDDILWRDYEEEVGHLVRLLETYSRNYRLAQEQYAKWGSALVPPIVVHTLAEAETSMMATLKRLETVLSKVYNQDIKTVS